MPDYHEVSRRLMLIHDAADEEQTLDRVLAFAVAATPCDVAGVMIVRGRQIESAAVTRGLARSADALQMRLNEGPCLSALRVNDNFRIEDTEADQRWPNWGPAAARLGIRSVLSTRMAGMDTAAIGSLNMYAEHVDAFGPDDVELARILAGHAAAAYLKARRAAAAGQALATRTTIGQAEGILMERFDLDAEAAFAVLRRYSQALNRPLRQVASELVTSRVLPAIDGEPSSEPRPKATS